MNNIQKLMKVNSPTTLLTILSIILIALISMLFINACENVAPVESPTNQLGEINIQNAADMEKVLRTLAMALPDVMVDEELSEMIYNEVSKNIEDEAYALWSEIADKSTPSGKTLRKVLDAEIENSLGKIKDITITTETFDKNNRLQVYIFNFDKWNKKDKLHIAYEPLTIDDVDVTELEVFKPNGKSYIMDVSDKDWEPDFPIIIVGFNEDYSQFNTVNDNSMSKKNSVQTGGRIMVKKVRVRKGRDLEPWYKGDLEMTVVNYYDNGYWNQYDVDNSKKSCRYYKYSNYDEYFINEWSNQFWMKIYEYDFLGVRDWVVDKGQINVTPGSCGQWWTAGTLDKGKWFSCGNYDRCYVTLCHIE